MDKKNIEHVTIDGFEKLTKQDIFDMAVDHIANTKVPSVGKVFGTNIDGCVYSGTGCNAAPLIKDGERNRADEVGSWHSLVDAGMASETNQTFIANLQNAHDIPASEEILGENDSFLTAWKMGMYVLAQEYNLDTSKLDSVEI